jgi:heme oxygenase
MTDSPDARHALRTDTAADHERVDRAFSAFDLTTREGYSGFLRAQAHGFLPVEAAIDGAGPHDIVPDWPARRRSQSLLADLDALGATPPVTATRPLFRSREEILGAIYVLEGSRLGGRMLARSVPADFPRAFIGSSDAGIWRTLIEILDKLLISDEQRTAASDGARGVFALFEAGARQEGTQLGR